MSLRDRISYVVEMRALDLVSALALWKRSHLTIRYGHVSKLPSLFNTFLFVVCLLPLSIGYFIWIQIPMLIYSFFCGYLILLLQIISKRSKHTKRLLIHVSALCKIGMSYIILPPHKNSVFTCLVPHCLQTISCCFPLISISECSLELPETADVHKVFSYD